jgi:N-methylhydantoinase A
MDVAQGIYDIANANMIEAIRGVTIYKGIDPRDYTLVSFGSAGAQHISAIAGELGIREILIPRLPGAFSAFGLICSDLKVDRTRSVVRELDAITDAELTESFEELERDALATLAAQGVPADGAVLQRYVEGYYVGQTWETAAKAPPGKFDPDMRAQLAEGFHSTHERLWAFRADELPIVILNIRVSAVGPVAKPQLRQIERGDGSVSESAVIHRRPVWLGGEAEGPTTIPFYDRVQLRALDRIEGPAAVVEVTTTTLMHAGDSCVVDGQGNLRITKEAN